MQSLLQPSRINKAVPSRFGVNEPYLDRVWNSIIDTLLTTVKAGLLAVECLFVARVKELATDMPDRRGIPITKQRRRCITPIHFIHCQIYF